MYRVPQQVMRGEHAWLETGIIPMIDDPTAPETKDAAPRARQVPQPV